MHRHRRPLGWPASSSQSSSLYTYHHAPVVPASSHRLLRAQPSSCSSPVLSAAAPCITVVYTSSYRRAPPRRRRTRAQLIGLAPVLRPRSRLGPAWACERRTRARGPGIGRSGRVPANSGPIRSRASGAAGARSTKRPRPPSPPRRPAAALAARRRRGSDPLAAADRCRPSSRASPRRSRRWASIRIK